MTKVAESIYGLLPTGQQEQDTVQPVFEHSSILHEFQLLKESLLDAPNRWDIQEDRITTLEAENMALKRELSSLSENQLIQLRLINQLRERPSEPTTEEHIKRIEKLLKDNPRRAMSFAELRGSLGLSAGRISQIVKRLDPTKFEIRRGTNYKTRTLVLRPRSL